MLICGHIPTGGLYSGGLATGTLTTGGLTTGTLTAGHLVTGTLTTGSLETGSLETGHLETGELVTGTLTTGHLETGSLVAGDVVSGTPVNFTMRRHRTARKTRRIRLVGAIQNIGHWPFKPLDQGAPEALEMEVKPVVPIFFGDAQQGDASKGRAAMIDTEELANFIVAIGTVVASIFPAEAPEFDDLAVEFERDEPFMWEGEEVHRTAKFDDVEPAMMREFGGLPLTEVLTVFSHHWGWVRGNTAEDQTRRAIEMQYFDTQLGNISNTISHPFGFGTKYANRVRFRPGMANKTRALEIAAEIRELLLQGIAQGLSLPAAPGLFITEDGPGYSEDFYYAPADETLNVTVNTRQMIVTQAQWEGFIGSGATLFAMREAAREKIREIGKCYAPFRRGKQSKWRPTD